MEKIKPKLKYIHNDKKLKNQIEMEKLFSIFKINFISPIVTNLENDSKISQLPNVNLKNSGNDNYLPEKKLTIPGHKENYLIENNLNSTMNKNTNKISIKIKPQLLLPSIKENSFVNYNFNNDKGTTNMNILKRCKIKLKTPFNLQLVNTKINLNNIFNNFQEIRQNHNFIRVDSEINSPEVEIYTVIIIYKFEF